MTVGSTGSATTTNSSSLKSRRNIRDERFGQRQTGKLTDISKSSGYDDEQELGRWPIPMTSKGDRFPARLSR